MTPAGSHPLTGTGALANVTVAFPGEHWSDRKASENITPGEAIVPAAAASGVGRWQVAGDSDVATQLAIALRPIDHPEPEHPRAFGPNELRNQVIETGEWVHAYYSGSFNLTLVDPGGSYEVGDLIGWDADGARPSGKDGTGSWAPNGDADIDSVFEVQHVREYGDGGEVVLTVKFAGRGQF